MEGKDASSRANPRGTKTHTPAEHGLLSLLAPLHSPWQPTHVRPRVCAPVPHTDEQLLHALQAVHVRSTPAHVPSIEPPSHVSTSIFIQGPTHTHTEKCNEYRLCTTLCLSRALFRRSRHSNHPRTHACAAAPPCRTPSCTRPTRPSQPTGSPGLGRGERSIDCVFRSQSSRMTRPPSTWSHRERHRHTTTHAPAAQVCVPVFDPLVQLP